MKTALEKFLDRLKSPPILDRKPHINLCSNHFKDDFISKGRHWPSTYRGFGQAFSDGKGWYRSAPL